MPAILAPKKCTGRQKTAKAWRCAHRGHGPLVQIVGLVQICKAAIAGMARSYRSWGWPTPTVAGLVLLSLRRCQRQYSLVYCLARLAVEFARSRRNLFGPVRRFCQYLQRSYCPRP